MTFEMYIKSPNLALATEIFEAEAHTITEVQGAIRRAQARHRCFDVIIRKYKRVASEIAKAQDYIDADVSRLPRFYEFGNSQEAKLMEDFIQNGNRDALAMLKEMITKANPFGVVIIPAWQPGNGERMYGIPYDEHFHVEYTNTYYKYNNWDLQGDIDNAESRLRDNKRKLKKLQKRRNQMLLKYNKSLSWFDNDYDDWDDYEEEW